MSALKFLNDKLSKMTCKIVSVQDQKGGVGKSTTANAVAYELAHKGKKVALIDFDPQASQTNVFVGLNDLTFISDKTNNVANIFDNETFEPIPITNEDETVIIDFYPANELLVDIFESSEVDYQEKLAGLPNFLVKIAENYDYIVIDCQPLFGVSNKSALIAADYLFVPVATKAVDENGIKRFFEKVNKTVEEYDLTLEKIFILPTMFKKVQVEAKEINYNITLLPRLIKSLKSIRHIPVKKLDAMPERAVVSRAAASSYFLRDWIECGYIDEDANVKALKILLNNIGEAIIKG